MGLNGASVFLHAGSNWNNGTNCRSRSRNANNYRWNTNTNIGTQFLADPRYISNLTPKMKLAKLTPWLESISLAHTEQNTKQEKGIG